MSEPDSCLHQPSFCWANSKHWDSDRTDSVKISLVRYVPKMKCSFNKLALSHSTLYLFSYYSKYLQWSQGNRWRWLIEVGPSLSTPPPCNSEFQFFSDKSFQQHNCDGAMQIVQTQKLEEYPLLYSLEVSKFSVCVNMCNEIFKMPFTNDQGLAGLSSYNTWVWKHPWVAYKRNLYLLLQSIQFPG